MNENLSSESFASALSRSVNRNNSHASRESWYDPKSSDEAVISGLIGLRVGSSVFVSQLVVLPPPTICRERDLHASVDKH